MDGNLLEILFVIAFIVIGLLGGRKKRSQQPTSRRPAQHPPVAQRPVARPAPRPAQARTSTSPRPAQTRTPPPRPTPERDGLLAELERIMEAARTGQMPEAAEPGEAESLERADVEDRRIQVDYNSTRWTEGLEAKSETVETLEPAGGKSHARFHAQYMTTPSVAAIVETEAPSPAGIARLKRAIILNEVLGPPVSLR